MAQHHGPRRARRDLALATLATGAAGLVVTVLVGGTTQDIRGVLVPGGDGDVASYAADLAGAPLPQATTDGVTVRVRPARSGVTVAAATTLLDLPAGRPVGRAGGAAPAAVGTRSETAVRGVLVDRGIAGPPVVTVAPGAEPVAAMPNAGATAAPSAVAAASSGSKPRRAKPKRQDPEPVVAAASGERVATDSRALSAAGDKRADKHEDKGADKHEDKDAKRPHEPSAGLPADASAGGRRTR